jgi:benzodiazapine receptor
MASALRSITGGRNHRGLALAGWLLACFLVAGISSIFIAKAMPTWYAALAKPPYTPPNQVFGPVWTVLYTLMAIAAWMIWKLLDSRTRSVGLTLFCVQLALNFTWSILFFSAHRIGLSFAEILILWAAILATMQVFFRLRRTAGWLLVPYLCWVTFASLLNWGILQRN